MDLPFEFDSDALEELPDRARALLAGQRDTVANAANLSALIFYSLDRVNWAGFYFLKGAQLLVGPFQGKPACVTIPLGRGVCGTAAATGEVQRVADVHAFDGHIVCDADSRSELVVPLFTGTRLLGVLDIDSPVPDRFGAEEQRLLEELAEIYVTACDWHDTRFD
jgi:L-methionine (R)-S-oxide reductase